MVVGLVQRLWGPTEGDIWIGGDERKRRLEKVAVRWLRDRLAVVSQQLTLFDMREYLLWSLAKAEEASTSTVNVITDMDIA